MSLDWDQTVTRVLEQHAPGISDALRSEVSSSTERRTGKLGRGFKHKIRRDSFGSPYGVSFSLPRYGYILHHGVKAGEITDPSRNRVYHTSGIEARGFLDRALSGKIDALADDLAKASGDHVTGIIRY